MKNKNQQITMVYDYAKWKFEIDGEELHGINDRAPIKILSTGILIKAWIVGNVIKKAYGGRTFTAKFENLVITMNIDSVVMLPNIEISFNAVPSITVRLGGHPTFGYKATTPSSLRTSSYVPKTGYYSAGYRTKDLEEPAKHQSDSLIATGISGRKYNMLAHPTISLQNPSRTSGVLITFKKHYSSKELKDIKRTLQTSIDKGFLFVK